MPPRPVIRAARRFLLAVVCVGLLASSAAAAQGARRIVILSGTEVMLPASQAADAEIRRVLSESDAGPFEVHSEGMDAFRFRSEGYDDELAAFLERKYGEKEPDLVFAFTEIAVDFLARHRHRLWPHAPVVFIAVEPSYFASHPRPDWITGVLSDDDMSETLALARRLLPKAKRVVIAAGSGPLDAGSIESARRDASRAAAGYEVKAVSGTPIADFPKAFGRLPGDTILLYTMMFRDSQGRSVVPVDAARALAAAASVPVFSVHATYLGTGILGGALFDYAHEGRAAGDIALRILRGEPPATIPLLDRSPRLHAVDDRVLRRFRIPEARLPTGYELRYRQPTFWEQYRWRIVAVGVTLGIETALLVALLAERQSRLRAERESRQRGQELAHATRLATVGELAASISHEINQPLGAILANAETAELLLESKGASPDELRRILADIRRDDVRASRVVSRVRALAGRRSIEMKPLAVNAIADAASALLEPEARRRGIVLERDFRAGLPEVRGDEISLQQVVINLALNGMEAMTETPSGLRRLSIATRDGAGRVLVRVSDTGRGIAADHEPRLFDSFFTTKRHGLGLGLSICRSIVDAHGGRIAAQNNGGSGATFEFDLPALSTAGAKAGP